ncbi:MFS general substrate transporter [Basidiobolus meristosporus CBS 931.73]|uniref:MFS general substrate transporter n=1 Tax=Basidiobolus meristosporus CBS 931.73 TaxID=1314790 RepID=A0A1Y1YPU5_9FUNG|nr:MFS general substrate transporter [Basidiobolus meristosporus CBS 931.73]|eukprot:ORY00048.1 MFS general substrate transporter [Basidiobolus meristosporus CBS 931.73]
MVFEKKQALLEGAPKSRYVEHAQFDHIDNCDPSITWTAEEEKALVRKVDLRVMTWIGLMFFFLQLDRGNLSNAMTDNFAEDLGMTINEVNVGTIIFVLSFVSLEIPSNMVIRRVGAERWIPFLMFLWGTVSWAQTFMYDRTTFYLSRFFLGLTEAGYIPGIILYMTTYYTRDELATRLSWFWGVLALADASSGLIAFGVLRLRSVCGLKGWQWLFLIDGVGTVIVALVSFFYLPAGPSKTKGLLRGKDGWFNDRQVKILVTRLIRDDPSKANGQRKGANLGDLTSALKDSRVWGHVLIGFFGLMAPAPVTSYMPLMIKGFGFNTVTSNLLTVPAHLLKLLFMLALTRNSDRVKDRAWHGVFGMTWFLLGVLLLEFLPDSVGKWPLYAVVIFTVGWPYWHPINAAWLTENVAPMGKRSIALAMYIMSVNINGLISSQIYRDDDKPRFHRGNWINIGIASFSILLFLAQRHHYVYLDRKRDRIWNSMTEEERKHYALTTHHVGNDRLDFRFSY